MARKKREFNLFEGAKPGGTEERASDVGYLEDLEKAGKGKEGDGAKKPAAPSGGASKATARPAAKSGSAKPARAKTTDGGKGGARPSPAKAQPPAKEYVRKTFVVSTEDVKLLDEIVHKEKSSGNYMYTYKEALGEAIHLLKKKRK